ncbi:hypothetical protein BB559_001560 [Furculomyces boomerangus]|uniref:GYF domain-containing protein n=1 Tax=Furculomyces boomerangus TaxID=61424 RepID=A0A2T9Z1E7_9FUNG|nr:hypothetical protein BB559_001560 [Furculomyces boomerangus]
MTTQMNFGPEWMRARLDTKSNDSPKKQDISQIKNLSDPQKSTPRKTYSLQQMIDLFDESLIKMPAEMKNRNELVFSETVLLPLEKVELTPEEAQKLSGPVNSELNRRFIMQQQAQQKRMQQLAQQQISLANQRKTSIDRRIGMPLNISSDINVHEFDEGRQWSSSKIRRGMVGTFGADGSFKYTEEGGLESISGKGQMRNQPLISNTSLASEESLVSLLEEPVWYYKDPKGALQGPFSGLSMQEWFIAGYFPEDLHVRRKDWNEFETLASITMQLQNTAEPFIVATLLEPTHSLIPSMDPHPVANLEQGENLPQPDVNETTPEGLDSGIIGEEAKELYNKILSQSTTSADNDPESSRHQVVAARSIQLAQILSEQENILVEISNHQQILQLLQQQAQQQLLQLGNALVQEQQQIRQQSHLSGAAVSQEYLARLQHQSRIAEESIRLELAQQTQVHMVHLTQLESALDPIVIDAVQRGGIPYAVALIRQQLRQLEAHIIMEQQALNAQNPDLESGNSGQTQSNLLDTYQQPQPIPGNFPGTHDISNLPTDESQLQSNVLKGIDEPKEEVSNDLPASGSIDKTISEALSKVDIGSTVAPKKGKTAGNRKSIDTSQQSKKEETKNQSQKGKPGPKQKNKNSSDSKDKDAKSTPEPTEKQSEGQGKKEKVTSKDSNKSQAVGKNKKNKQEQEGVANSKHTNESSSPKRLENEDTGTASPQNEQTKPETKSNPWVTTGSTVKKSIAQIQQEEALAKAKAQPQTQSPISYANSKSYASLVGSPKVGNTPKPSPEFVNWCRSSLSSLKDIDLEEFIQVLFSFPMDPPKSSLEIISDQIYAHSQSLNGKSFAAEFVKRRKEDAGGLKKTVGQSTPQSDFQVVGKKGKKNRS